MGNKYRCSVVIATYNGEKFVAEQLKSIENQTVKPFEIIISDDGSTDNTVSAIKEYIKSAELDIKLLLNDGEHGVTGNFENAAKQATGDIVFFCDQDDVWLENRVEEYLKAFDKYPDSIGVFANAVCVDADLKPYNTCFLDESFSNYKSLAFDKYGYYVIKRYEYLPVSLFSNFLPGCLLAIKNTYLKRYIPFERTCVHDDWICNCMMATGSTVVINKSLMLYRLHGNNTIGLDEVNKKKKIKRSVKERIDRLKLSITSEVSRYIAISKFAVENGFKDIELTEAHQILKVKLKALVSSKTDGIKKIKRIFIKNNQYKTRYYYIHVLYILIFSKKSRRNDLKEYMDYFKITPK